MKKDVDKLLSRTIVTYLTLLFAVFILKLFGLNYFGLDTENVVMNKINNFISYWRLENVWYAITLYLNAFIIMSITANDNTKKMKIYVLLCMPIFVIFQKLKYVFNLSTICVIIDLLYLFILAICYILIVNKEKVHKYNIGNYWLFMISSTIFQIISLATRDTSIAIHDNFIINTIISLDYLIICLFVYKLYFIKGGNSLCQMVHSYSSVLLISLKQLPKKLQTSYQDAKPKTQEENLANKIYLVLFWLYNIFTVVFILFVATLNDTFIECIFILSSFWINKGAFGKAFHLKKASTCFVVSTLSYYALNRITWKIGLSFLIPIILGIALSYITSKIMDKYSVTRLYRGMPEEDFYNLITRVTDDNKHIEICKRFYIDGHSDVKIGIDFNYSTINIKKIKGNINKKIKELQK